VNLVVAIAHGNLKMENNIQCPVCDDVATLTSNLNDVYVGKIQSKIWVKFISYQCDYCEESFTTTETDEFNLGEINRGIRKFQRMSKINNILK